MDDNKHLTFEHLFTKKLKDAFNKKEGRVKRVYAVMGFNTELQLGISNKPYEWVNSASTVTVNGKEALIVYQHSKEPIVKIIDASSFDELNNKMVQMTKNFKNPTYVTHELESTFYE